MRQLAVAEDPGFRILLGQSLEQLIERVLLGLSAGVGRMAVLIKTAFVDNAKGTVIVVLGMDALDGLGQQGNDVAITADIVVVTALAILGFAAGYQVFNAERAVALVGDAVDNQEGYFLKGLHFTRRIGRR